jgi:hypothetical protein
MKTSIRTIGVALLVLSAFVGFAAADVSEPPDAGSSCSNARWFNAPPGYTNIDGTLTSDPADTVDCWRSNTPSVGDTLYVYLDNTAYQNGVAAELLDGNCDLMQRVHISGSQCYDSTLDATPACVCVSSEFPGYDYTAVLYHG